MSQRHFVTLLLAITLAGCVFSKLEDDLAKLESVSHVFSGSISAGETHSNAFVVIAMHGSEGDGIAGFRMLSGPGPFELRLESAPFYFFAFDDLNKDLTFQSDEPYGWAARGEAVVPVWRDLDPDSEYVATLFDTPLPGGLPHHLLFGFRQDSIFGSESSDGVIALSSQLRPAAQDQAVLIRGYDEDHVSILSSEAAVNKVHQILAESSQ